MPTEEPIRFALITLATVFTLLVLAALHLCGVSSGLLLLVPVTCAFWYSVAYQSGVARKAASARRNPGHELVLVPAVMDSGIDPLEQFYSRLLGSLDHSWLAFKKHFRHTEKSLHNVKDSLDKALDMTQNTGLLAVNAMMAAASCGEVGRGFITVSQDLASISERSTDDLGQLRQLVASLSQDLVRLEVLLEHPLDFWIVSSAGLPVQELVKVRAELEHSQNQLRSLGDRYRRAPQLDVRWLQLGDAVKRLLNELTNTLFQLELHLDDVISDMRLLKLAEGSGSGQQIVEIKDRNHFNREPGGLTQKFIQ